MLWGLPNLRHLERGDFLADVIEDLEEKANMANNENMKNSKAIKRIPSLKVGIKTIYCCKLNITEISTLV